MKYETLIDEALGKFPEIRDLAQQKPYWQGNDEHDPLVHVFFGDVLNRFLIEQLSLMKNVGLLQRIFEFMESMAVSEDKSVRDLLSTGMLEVLGDDKHILERARTLMGSNTLRMSHEIEKSWGREK
jgi:hypothetical protein